jgi:hypothetical protein
MDYQSGDCLLQLLAARLRHFGVGEGDELQPLQSRQVLDCPVIDRDPAEIETLQLQQADEVFQPLTWLPSSHPG